MGTKEKDSGDLVKRNYHPTYTEQYPSDVPDMQEQYEHVSFFQKCKNEPFITAAIATGAIMLFNGIRLYPKRKFHQRIPMDYAIAWRVYFQGSIVGVCALALIHSRYRRWKNTEEGAAFKWPWQKTAQEKPV